MIVDTDVLIWYARKNPAAVEQLHKLQDLSISVVTYMEIIQGVKNKRELNAFKKALAALKISVLQIDDMISVNAMFFVEQYALSHAMELADALIGATSVVRQVPLLTANLKHYAHLPDIRLVAFLPA